MFVEEQSKDFSKDVRKTTISIMNGGGFHNSSSRPTPSLRSLTRHITDADRRILAEVWQRTASSYGEMLYVRREDLKAAIIMLFGHRPLRAELDSLLSHADLQVPESCPALSFDCFERLMLSKLALIHPDDTLRDAFKSFDAHSRGFVALDDFSAGLRSVMPHISVHAVERAFRTLDLDSDGRLTFRDFENAARLAALDI